MREGRYWEEEEKKDLQTMWRRNRNMETCLGRIQDVKRRRRRELAGGMWKDSGRGRGGGALDEGGRG